ncbi:MAG: N-acetylneuraminic acid mutarotase [Arenicella sp.]
MPNNYVLANQTVAWSSAAPLPINVQELYPAVHKGKLYVAGGIASKLGIIYFTDNVVSYDPASNQWTVDTKQSEDLHHAALVSAGDRLFLVGGFNGGYSHIWKMRNHVYEYVEQQWIETVSLPKPQAEGVLAANNDVVHLVSGQSGQ